ncbi:MAG TPA: choice-of-anchor tandem repeat GloVer-containing protein [Terracidiphilus sp.]|nr:choice-of-anchor tandem repeat GloVer-containing protein [Terracidiphilus sp.]
MNHEFWLLRRLRFCSSYILRLVFMIPLRQSGGVLVLSLTLAICSGCGSGEGTEGGSNPPAQTYTIGGTVSGLVSGTSLQLTFNTTHFITLTADGAFSFTGGIESGGTYDVWVSKQPVDPLQFCVASNGTGTALSDVTNIQVVCNTPTEQDLYNFGQQPDGVNPIGTPVLDKQGNLYGVTKYGGANGQGTVFMLTPSNGQWTKTVIYTFCQIAGCADGSEPNSGLIWDAAGNLYGTTSTGGAFGSGLAGGVVYKLSPSGIGTWTETVLHSFGNGTDGKVDSEATSGLVFDSSGNLYGTTTVGGTGGDCLGNGGCGTVFELSPNPDGTWTESILYNFCSVTGTYNCYDGALPSGGVVLDAAGNLYGTTAEGGGTPNAGVGTVFELIRQPGNQWTEKVLYIFQPGADINYPDGGVIFDAAGNLYGTTRLSSAIGSGGGAVYELSPGRGGQWQNTTLHSFNVWDGYKPSGPLAIDAQGNLYGTTDGGGTAGAGTVFALTQGVANPQAAWVESTLYNFTYLYNGSGSISGLAIDVQGNLYGVGYVLGTEGNGMVFKVTP